MELIDTLGQDLRHAARRLWRAPGFTLVAALTLALGIGGNAAVLSALEALLLRPPALPGPRPAGAGAPDRPDGSRAAPWPRPISSTGARAPRSFAGLAAYEVVGRTLLARESALRLDTGIVSGSFFDVLGTRAALGRTFGAAADGPREAVLGHALWQDQFGADAGIVGRELQLDQELVRVTGVMPAGFAFPSEAELWLRAQDDLPELPIAANASLRTLRDSRYLGVRGAPARGCVARGGPGRDGPRRRGAGTRVSRRELRPGRTRRAALRGTARQARAPRSCCCWA